MPNDTMPNDTTPNDTMPNDTTPNDTMPNDTIANTAMPNDTASERRGKSGAPRRSAGAIEAAWPRSSTGDYATVAELMGDIGEIERQRAAARRLMPAHVRIMHALHPHLSHGHSRA